GRDLRHDHGRPCRAHRPPGAQAPLRLRGRGRAADRRGPHGRGSRIRLPPLAFQSALNADSPTEIVMGKAIEELAHFAAATPWEAIPATVRGHAKLVLLDTLGVILVGSVQPEVAGARARLTASGGRGATVYAPGWRRGPSHIRTVRRPCSARSLPARGYAARPPSR